MKTNFTLTRNTTIFILAAVMLFTATATAQTFRLFNPLTQGPGDPTDPDANVPINNPGGAETGLRFQVTQGGTISAIHFFEGVNSDGPHVVNLWLSTGATTGTNLATATLPADGGFGWRTVTLTPAVALLPNVTYVISVFNPTGIVSRSSNDLLPNDIQLGPFIVIGWDASAADPANPANGVFQFTGTSAFPGGEDPDGSNFWLDLTFTTFFPLPVTLTDFKATTASSNVTLSWKTEFEANNKGFELQRSNNGSTWYEVSFINGVGESNSTKTYSYTDKGLAPGLYHYRLVQKDFDGKTKTSSTVTAEIEGRGKVALLQNAPNPFHSTSKIRFDLPSSQRVRLSVWDISGREIKVLVNGTRESGSHIVTLDAAGLSPQTYYVRLQTEEGTFTQKIVVN